MDWLQTLSQLIGSLGFPIVCCGYMMFTCNKTVQQNTESTNELCLLIREFLKRESNHE